MSTYKAVKVGGRTFFKLMQNNEHVLLFPGGVKEVCVVERLLSRESVTESFISIRGAVRVSRRTLFKLMQNNEHVLLFPGGVKEVCMGHCGLEGRSHSSADYHKAVLCLVCWYMHC